MTKALKIPIPNIEQWSDFGRKALAPPPKITAKLKPKSLEKVEAIIGHKIARPHLLAQALVSLANRLYFAYLMCSVFQTHSSTQGFESTSYERLEFVGDAVLDFSGYYAF